MPPTTPTIDLFTDEVLEIFFEPGALARGEGYFHDERVTLIETKPGSIDAVCAGSDRSSYVVRMRWSTAQGSVRLDDRCSCPLGGGCKHCVATILTARREHNATPGTGAPNHGDGRGHGDAAWRQVLAELVSRNETEPAVVPLALSVSVQRPTSSHHQPNPQMRVAVRPMRWGASGKWIKSGASWRDLASLYTYGPDTFDPRQRAALRALMTSGRIDSYGAPSTPVPLNQFGADAWYLLERALDAGVELIGEAPLDAVELSRTPVHTHIDLAADDRGAVTVSIVFLVDGEPLLCGDELAGLVGTPPHGLWVAEGTQLRLHPLDKPLHPNLARLAVRALTVPAHDVDDLLDAYVPSLALHGTVGSADGSVTIATNEFDGLVLRIERTALDVASVCWFVRYRRGDKITRHPLHRPGGRGRDHGAEAAALDTLVLPTDLLGALAGPDDRPRDVQFTGTDTIALLGEVVPWFAANSDVEVEVLGEQPVLHEATADPLIELSVLDTDDGRDGTDWFDLHVEVSVDGQQVDFATLFAALDRDDDVLVLASGTWLRLDHPALDRLRDLIDEARGLTEPSSTGVARLNRFQTSWWEELCELGVVRAQSDRWETSIATLGQLAAPEPVPVPTGLHAELRPYQQTGVDWLVFLYRNRLGGVLADDMGLGKTVQTLALCLQVLATDPDARILVIAPTSVVENWAREAARFTPDIAVRTIRETAKRRGTTLAEEIAGANIVVTSYALFRIEFDDYACTDWAVMLLDEAQFVKNHQGKTYQCVRRLDVATKIAITGTPLENSLMDLWSLLSIAAPGLYPDPARFSETYRKPIERGEAPELLATLRRRIAPLMRRRTKDAVLTELPPKTEQIVEVELSARHARIYATQLQRQRQKVLGLVGDVQRHRFEILKSLTLLRQLALDPGLVDPAHEAVGSAKLDRLLDDLTQVVAEGHRALVFSQFTRYLARVRTRLDAAGIDHSYLDGRTRRRDTAISKFKDGDAPVFVISLKAGGFGLNLTEADYCFVLDPWWNPATETQAVDRAHRIGQQNSVMVYRYVSANTIEEKVMELKARKADLFSSVMDADGALSGALSDDDIRNLFEIG